jgi:UPF0755 protein
MRTWSRTLLGLLALAVLAFGLLAALPWLARRAYGPPAEWLNPLQVVEYSTKLLWADGVLTRPMDSRAIESGFEVQSGDSVSSICRRLEQAGFVADGEALRDYLIYSGQDTTLQAGKYQLSASMSAIEIAGRMQDASPAVVEFVVLAGWRIEEIAAALPTSGLMIGTEEFIVAAHSPRAGFDFLEETSTLEGFLFPDSYLLPRSTGLTGLLDALLAGFARHLSAELRDGILAEGLSVREAVVLASIVQREAMQPEEAPLIASVYLNRLRGGMRLDADPTVQYAIGFNAVQQTWWTNPLGLADLRVDSPFNTYQVDGLPPAPIANPGSEALRAIAEPASSPYYYFNARCDGSGYHEFSETFSEHLGSLCP